MKMKMNESCLTPNLQKNHKIHSLKIMPPKAAAAPAVEEKAPDAAPFIHVNIGLAELPLKLLLNINCPVAICLDYAKRKYILKIKEEITSLKTSIEAISIPPQPEGSDPIPLAEGAIAPEKEKLEENLSKFESVLSDLTNDHVVLDLQKEGGSVADCSKVLRSVMS
jgi:hypothetical protein